MWRVGCKKHVDEHDERRSDAQSDNEVVEALARDLRAEPLEVDFDKGEKKVEATPVSVRDVFGGNATVPGPIFTKKFSFTGYGDL